MNALYLQDGELSYHRDWPKPAPEPGQALIRVTFAGICSTDLELVRGYAGFTGIPGHEFVGIVEESADERWNGRRVVGGINLGCGLCSQCLSHGPEHCPNGSVLGIINHDGAFAEYLLLPVENLHLVPDELSDEEAVFTEPLAAALRILEQTTVPPSARIAVIGPGKLGMLIGQVLQLAGSEVVMLGRRAESLVLAADLGMTTGIVDDIGDDEFHFVVEATGNDAGLRHALRIVRPLGKLVLKSTFSGETQADLTKIVVSEIEVIGSRCGPFEPAIRLLARRKIQTAPMIDGVYQLRDGLLAFEHAQKSGVRKILLYP